MNELLILYLSLYLPLLFIAYRYSGGFFSLPFLVMAYITLLYFGALNYYFTLGHYTFIGVYFIALFHLTGILAANRIFRFKKAGNYNNPCIIYNPWNTPVLKIVLVITFLFALAMGVYRLKEFGVVLLDRTWYSTGILSTTGVYNRLLFTLGTVSLQILSLLAYGLNKCQNKKKYSISFCFFLPVSWCWQF